VRKRSAAALLSALKARLAGGHASVTSLLEFDLRSDTPTPLQQAASPPTGPKFSLSRTTSEAGHSTGPARELTSTSQDCPTKRDSCLCCSLLLRVWAAKAALRVGKITQCYSSGSWQAGSRFAFSAIDRVRVCARRRHRRLEDDR
jgi:hypothetical protein